MVTLFQNPISTAPPPAIYPQSAHFQPPVGNALPPNTPIQTNNTFNNLLLGDQNCPVWPLPYLLWIAKENTDSGVSFNHTERSQLVFGPDPNKSTAQYYFNPPFIRLFTLTGEGWGRNVNFKVTAGGKLHATVEATSGRGTLTMPLVHGMGFVTGIYKNEKPTVHSSVGIQEFRKVGMVNGGRTAKYVMKLFNQVVWSLYVSGDPNNTFRLADPNHIKASNGTGNCVVQICRGDNAAYDAACGKYPVLATVYADVDPGARKGNYGFSYKTVGESQRGTAIVWALPHQIANLDGETASKNTGLKLDSPTKGMMQAYATNKLGMTVPDLPIEIGFDPWTSVPGFGYSSSNYSGAVRDLIAKAARNEVEQDVAGACDLDSMYFGGKQLDKYAIIAFVTHFVLRDSALTQKILPKVKKAVEKFALNKQKHPLKYDTTWKGIISNTPKEQDFGNSNYNDHHFHYGYHVHAIALIAKIDPSWLDANNRLIRNYVLTLVRDYANPSEKDPYFPQSRNFDWYNGHSFAHGIFPSGDGKNEESSSEDYHSVYALKLLGEVLGDEQMKLGASLMLAILRRSLNLYMMFTNDNTVQPDKMKRNKVSGILFENKIDHATFFGFGNIGDEFVHGIHMLPISPVSSYIRGPKFAKEEWDEKLVSIVDKIPDGWQGILKLNQSLFDPKASWKWFSRSNWNEALIDPGMSRTWSLTYLAGIGAAK